MDDVKLNKKKKLINMTEKSKEITINGFIELKNRLSHLSVTLKIKS